MYWLRTVTRIPRVTVVELVASIIRPLAGRTIDDGPKLGYRRAVGRAARRRRPARATMTPTRRPRPPSNVVLRVGRPGAAQLQSPGSAHSRERPFFGWKSQSSGSEF